MKPLKPRDPPRPSYRRRIAPPAAVTIIVLAALVCRSPEATKTGVAPNPSQNVYERRDDEFTGRADESKPAAVPSGLPEATLDTHIRQLQELQAAATKELALSAEQQAAVEALFETHVRTVRGTGGIRPFGVDPEDAEAVEKLRTKLIAAKEANNQEEARQLTAQFQELIQSRRAATGVTSDQFLAKVIAVLDQEQTAAFRALIKRLRFGDARSGPSVDLNRFWRALLHPDVDLSDAQRQSIHELRTEAERRTADARARNAGDELPRIGEETRAQVTSMLSPEQRARLEAILNKPPHRGRTEPGQAPTDTSVPP